MLTVAMDKYLVKKGGKRVPTAAGGGDELEELSSGGHQPKRPHSDGVGGQGDDPTICSKGSKKSRKEGPSFVGAAVHPPDHQIRAELATGDKELWQVNTEVVTKLVRGGHGMNVTYYPCFFTARAGTIILQELERELSPFLCSSHATNVVKLMGRVCPIPRQQAAFGDPGLSYTFSGVTLPASPWTPTLLKLKDSVEEAIDQPFNFVLVNHYRTGSDHMGEHRDNEQELCPQAPIASLSFGQERDFVFRHRDARGRGARRKEIKPVKVCLAHGSLLVMYPPTNREWYHSLPARKNAPWARLNLTFRKMKKGIGAQGRIDS